jgi:purine-binding chemotaxis protein CheW
MTALVNVAEQPAPDTPQDALQYLTFMLGGETFAIGILAIKEIIEYGNLTEVPMMPDFIRGVINLRGSVVPVVDLSARFGRKGSGITRRTCIVIIEVANGEEKQVLGVVVDAVNEVLEIPQDEIEAPPAFGARIRTDFIRGMGKVDGRFVIILNVDNVLSLDDLALLEHAHEVSAAGGEAAR